MKQGYVYILTNPAFKEDWVKIGKTAGDVERRMAELFNTAVPKPFDLYAWCKTSKFSELETQMHHILDKLSHSRVTDNREFFNIVPSEALSVLRDLASTLDDAEFYCPYEHDKNTTQQTHAPKFRFKMANLKPGDKVIFEPTGVEVVVADDPSDKKVEYGGEFYTLTGFCRAFMPDEKRNNADAYQGPKYFSYKGTLLSVLRNQNNDEEEN